MSEDREVSYASTGMSGIGTSPTSSSRYDVSYGPTGVMTGFSLSSSPQVVGDIPILPPHLQTIAPTGIHPIGFVTSHYLDAPHSIIARPKVDTPGPVVPKAGPSRRRTGRSRKPIEDHEEVPLPPGMTKDDLIPKVYYDEVTGDHIYPCPQCPKKYTGKHARSIWRRHLQDKHHIPLAQQPRRTRWDNDDNRPKNDTERRTRTLESKRRWARKNRGTGKKEDGDDMDEDDEEPTEEQVATQNTLNVPDILLRSTMARGSQAQPREGSLYHANNSGSPVIRSTASSPSLHGDLHAQFPCLLAVDGTSRPMATRSVSFNGLPSYSMSVDLSPPPAPLVHRTASAPGNSSPAARLFQATTGPSLHLAIPQGRVDAGPLSAPLFPSHGPQPRFFSQPSSPVIDGEEAITKRPNPLPSPQPEEQKDAASVLLQLKTASSPDRAESSFNTTYRSSELTAFSFRPPSSPNSSPSSLEKITVEARQRYTSGLMGPLIPLPPMSESVISSSPWPSTPRGVAFRGARHHMPTHFNMPMMPDEFKAPPRPLLLSSPSGPPSAHTGFMLSSPANPGLSTELGLAPTSHYNATDSPYNSAMVPQQVLQQPQQMPHPPSSTLKPQMMAARLRRSRSGSDGQNVPELA